MRVLHFHISYRSRNKRTEREKNLTVSQTVSILLSSRPFYFIMIYTIVFILLSTFNHVTSEANGTNVNPKFIRNFCSKIHITSHIGCCWVGKVILFLGYTTLAFILAFIVIPLLFCIFGFQSIGVRRGSYAARYQAVHGTPKSFSCLQSLSMKRTLEWIIVITSTSLAAMKVFYCDNKCKRQ
jgi:hypothetical protein